MLKVEGVFIMINSIYYSFKAIKGQQWFKPTYTASISFVQVADLCKIDPDVQRNADHKRMEAIAEYILDGFSGKRFMTGFNAIVTSLRNSSLEYNEDTCEVRISTRGKLYIADGQHRCGGIKLCVEKVEAALEEARNSDDKEGLEYWGSILKDLEETNLPVVIFTDLMKNDEKQLFHDLNNLGVSVNHSQALYLDHNDQFNLLSKKLENEIVQLKKFGLNKVAKTLSDKSTQVATLGVWNNCNRIVLNGSTDKEMNKEWDESWDFSEKKELCKDFWQTFFNVLPEDFVNKEKYMITKSAYLQGVAAFGHKIIFEDKISDWKSRIIKLQNFDWSYSNDAYTRYGGGSLAVKINKKTGTEYTRFYFKGTRAAINSITKVLDNYTKYNS